MGGVSSGDSGYGFCHSRLGVVSGQEEASEVEVNDLLAEDADEDADPVRELHNLISLTEEHPYMNSTPAPRTISRVNTDEIERLLARLSTFAAVDEAS